MNAFCHLCDGKRLFKDPVQEKKDKLITREENKRKEKEEAVIKTKKKEKKEGMAFEKRVVSTWNSRMSPSSKKKKAVGKPRFDIDDMLEDEKAPEPKEPVNTLLLNNVHAVLNAKNKASTYEKPEARQQSNSGAMWYAKGDIILDHALMECKERGSVNARGEKTITIPKAWLEKQEVEAYQEKRDYWYLPFGYKNSEDIYLIKPFDHEMELIAEIRSLRKKIDELEKR